MKKMNKNRIYSVMSSVLFVLIILTVVVLFGTLKINEPKLNAEAMKITVNKKVSVDIYIYGEDVVYDEKASNLAVDVYYAEEGSEIHVRAINDTSIFTQFNIVNDGVSSTSTTSHTSLTANGEVTIDFEVKKAEGFVNGQLLYDMIPVTEASHLVAIQKILTHGPGNLNNAIIAEYDKLFNSNHAYKSATDKAAFITEKGLFNTVQTGYYGINNNLSVFSNEFTGIGNATYPFKGVFVGNDERTKIISTINAAESNGNNYYGLFGVLDKEATLLNLDLYTAIGITKSPTNIGTDATADNLYVGGIAGKINNALIYNTTSAAIISIDAGYSTIYAGGITGHLTGGFSSVNKSDYDGSLTNWIINNSSRNNNYVGNIAGYADGAYLKDYNINTTNNDIMLSSSSASSIDTSNYMGTIFGYYNGSKVSEISNVSIKAESESKLQSIVHYGTSYVGGAIGYVNATNELVVGEIKFVNTSKYKNNFISQSFSKDSHANVYAAGLFAQTSGTVTASDEFKVNIKDIAIDDKIIKKGEYIFSGNYHIEATSHGVNPRDRSYGKCISAGMVAKGYFNILGTDDINSQILINDGSGLFEVVATQTQTAAHADYNATSKEVNQASDIEHCIASLVFGIISTSANTTTYNNVDIYTTNVLINAIRENGSRGMGDVRVSGFNGYSNDTSYQNINLYINNSHFKLDSISYEVENNNDDTNNAYCGGLFAEVEGNSNNSSASVRNCKLSGYVESSFEETGTTLKIDTIQNAQAPGGQNYRNEGYVGGIIGQLWRVKTVDGLLYNGSTGDDDHVILQSHENPDSIFCGGIIGFIKVNADYDPINISNCKIKNAKVQVYATNIRNFNNPDIMLGGIVGAVYTESGYTSNYTDLHVYNCEINAFGYENMEANAAGIVGAMPWSGTQNFENCYVFGSNITATTVIESTDLDDDRTHAAGIMACGQSSTLRIYNSAVIDSNIIANGWTQNRTVAAGMYAQRTSCTPTFHNVYINSKVEAYVQGTLTSAITYRFGNTGSVSNTVDGVTDYNYYTSNVPGTSNNDFHKIDTSDFEVSAADISIEDIIYYHSGRKVYPVLKNGTDFVVNNAGTTNDVTISKTTSRTYATDIMDLWVNVKSGGDTSNPSLLSEEEAHDLGWFKIASINIYSGSYSTDDLEHLNDNLSVQYDDGTNTYKFKEEDSEGKRYLSHILDSSILTRTGYFEDVTSSNVTLGTNSFTVVRDIDVNVYQGIQSMIVNFSVIGMPLYNLIMVDSNGNEIDSNANNKDNYGTYDYEYQVNGTKIDYTLTYYPNPEMSGKDDLTFYFIFRIGTTTTPIYEKACIRINLSPNVRKLIGVEPATYSPPLNIRDAIVGTESNPYLLEVGSITKFIPVFTRVNDIEYKEYRDDTNIDFVTYGTNAGTVASARSNGELTINSHNNTNIYTITVIPKDYDINPAEHTHTFTNCECSCGAQRATAYFETIATENVRTVTYTVTGADLTSIGKATNECDFYFDLAIYSSYSSILKNLTITIGDTVFNDYRLIADGVELTGDAPLKGEEYIEGYTVIVPAYAVTGNINITLTLDVVYDITFVLNCDKFNDIYVGPKSKTFKVIAGTSLATYFENTAATDEVIDQLNKWVEEATLFGYAFNGFYLVDNADSLPAYGYDLVSLINHGATINTSLTFYGCWSFLIELIEAPGTHITTSFADSFMKDYYNEDKVTQTIQIPINSNRGYIFTIEKDEGFIGEAEVKAFALTKLDDEIITSEIQVEKYHENQYLYYIPPSAIKGYLVIATSVSNSELIVGENTASVTDELLPHDGVYTFKYVVNHKNTADDKSFIYNSGIVGNESSNLNYNRDIMLEFFEESFDGVNLGETTRNLENGTVIEVYYHLYVDGVKTQTIVGSYTVENNTTTRVFLKDFTLINNDDSTRAFKDITFRDLLGNNEMVSEVYYFSITPPNGNTHQENRIINYIVNAGYYYYKDGNYRYIEGVRSQKDFINKPIQGQLNNFVMHESALHKNMYSVSPSRETEIEIVDKDELIFNYKDITQYEIIDLKLTNSEITSGDYIKLKGTIGSRSELISSELGFFIRRVRFTAGYNTGNIDVYGSNDGEVWTKVATINVESEEYTEYSVDFHHHFTYFKLDNVSGNDIHISKVIVSDLQTAIPYEIEFLSTLMPRIDGDGVHHYTIINDIVGDTRHEGKKFMLAVQIYDANGNIVESIDPTVSLLVNGTSYLPNDADLLGKSVAFFNLSEIKDAQGTETYNFQLVLPNSYDDYQVVLQLVEAKLSYKPAMDEVRQTVSVLTKVNVKYEFVYINSATSTSPVVNTNPTVLTGNVGLVSASQGDLVFGGWFSDKELTKQISSISLENNNDTIYGAFYPAGTPIRTASFKANETTLLEIILPAGGNVIVPSIDESLIPTGYKFAGFSDGTNTYATNDVFSMPDNNVELNAVFEINSYTITFDAAGGDHVGSITQDYNSVIDYSTLVMNRTGYTFAGWDTNYDNIPDELPERMPAYSFTVHAVWNPITYVIKYNANGATSGIMLDQEVKYDESATLYTMNFVYPGHQFVGWSTGVETNPSYQDNDKVKNLSSTQGEVINLYAIWKRVITITFNSQGGSTVPTASALYDEYLTVPEEPTRVGYTFAGWFREAACVNEFDFENTKVQTNMTLYAKWTINQYTVTFKDQNGEIISQITDDYGKAITVPTLPTVTGYTVSWNETPVTSIPAENKDYSIVSTVIVYKITYENILAGTNNNVTEYTVEDDFEFNNITGTNNGTVRFIRWEINGEIVTGIDKGTTGDIVVRARYSIRVRFSAQNRTYDISVSTKNGVFYSDANLQNESPIEDNTNLSNGNNNRITKYVLDGTIIIIEKAARDGQTQNRTVKINNTNYTIGDEYTVNSETNITVSG